MRAYGTAASALGYSHLAAYDHVLGGDTTVLGEAPLLAAVAGRIGDPQVRHRRGIRLQQRVRPRGERVVRDGPVDPGVPGRMRWRGRDTTGRSAEKALEFDAA